MLFVAAQPAHSADSASLAPRRGLAASRWAAGRKAWREWSFRHPLLAGAGSDSRPFPLAGGGGWSSLGRNRGEGGARLGRRVLRGRRRPAGCGGVVIPGVGRKGARGSFGRRALFPGPGREGSRRLVGQWALREGGAGGVAGRPEALRSFRGEALSAGGGRWGGGR